MDHPVPHPGGHGPPRPSALGVMDHPALQQWRTETTPALSRDHSFIRLDGPSEQAGDKTKKFPRHFADGAGLVD